MNRFIGVFLMLVSLQVLAQDNPTDVVDNFFKEFAEKGSDLEVQNYYPVNLWGENRDVEILRLRSRLEEISQAKVGKFISTELVEEDQVIKTYKILSYKVIFERQTIKLIFSLNLHDNKWMITDLDINKYIYDHPSY